MFILLEKIFFSIRCTSPDQQNKYTAVWKKSAKQNAVLDKYNCNVGSVTTIRDSFTTMLSVIQLRLNTTATHTDVMVSTH